jgi:hypothetical protein
MDGCKNRAPGSLEWKEGEGEREGFEKWYVDNAFDLGKDPIGSRDCSLQWKSYQSRQPEIDALKAENEKLRKEIQSLKRPNNGIEGLLMNGMLTMTTPDTKGEAE